MKKLLTLLLSLVLLLSVLPVASFAATDDLSEDQAIRREVRRIYSKCLDSAGKTSFYGYCGQMTSMQLYHLGITDGGDGSFDGNQQFDYYSASPVTTGGYRTTSYSAKEYTLEEALNAITRNGTRNASNILIGFEATNTEAGSVYGHALVIHRIVNGTIYYVENYATSLAGPEGNVIACSISQFVEFYKDWTVFDGAVHFGTKDYSAGCQSFGTDLYLRTRFSSTLRSEPCLLTENDCTRLRTLASGELLHATAVYRNTRGEWYYRIDDGGRIGFVAANAVSVVQIAPQALQVEDLWLPVVAEAGKKIDLTGNVYAENCDISALRLAVTNASGRVLRETALEVSDTSFDLQQFSEQMRISGLEDGWYTLTLYGTAACVAVRGAGLEVRSCEIALYSQKMAFGKVSRMEDVQLQQTEAAPEGWFPRDGKWYCYRDGAPVTGWETWLGVSYYLDENGAVTTGWAEIDGQMRYFSPTGALCREWVTTEQGTHYWYRNGNLARGWQTIAGKLYCFDENGILQTDCTLDYQNATYTIDKSGVATIKK